MTFQLRHDWEGGAAIVSATIATCANCETLRVLERDAIPFVRDRAHYIKRAIDPSSPKDRPTNLILEAEPPCIGAPPFFRAPW